MRWIVAIVIVLGIWYMGVQYGKCRAAGGGEECVLRMLAAVPIALEGK
jgi:hypothetical protein